MFYNKLISHLITQCFEINPSSFPKNIKNNINLQVQLKILDFIIKLNIFFVTTLVKVSA